MVKRVLQELKQEARAAMKLLSITATMGPFYICIYIYIYTHIHTYIYIYMI